MRTEYIVVSHIGRSHIYKSEDDQASWTKRIRRARRYSFEGAMDMVRFLFADQPKAEVEIREIQRRKDSGTKH